MTPTIACRLNVDSCLVALLIVKDSQIAGLDRVQTHAPLPEPFLQHRMRYPRHFWFNTRHDHHKHTGNLIIMIMHDFFSRLKDGHSFRLLRKKKKTNHIWRKNYLSQTLKKLDSSVLLVFKVILGPKFLGHFWHFRFQTSTLEFFELLWPVPKRSIIFKCYSVFVQIFNPANFENSA